MNHTSYGIGRCVRAVVAVLALLLGLGSAAVVQAQPWRIASPAAYGLDSLAVARAYDHGEDLAPLNSLLIARHGDLVAEQYYRGMTAEQLVNIKSASKSILSALVGIALAEGHLDTLGQSALSFFPEYVDADTDPRKRAITLRHLLMMTAGLETTSFGNYGAWVTTDDWTRAALDQPMVDLPGGRMIYSTGSSHLVSAILTRATGESTLAFARRTLFGPLGIDRVRWDRSPEGVYFGGNNMALRPRDLLRFGQAYLDGGRAQGEQVIPADWVQASTQPYVFRSFRGFKYGYFWWIHSFAGVETVFAWGHGGQLLFVVPEYDLVVVCTSSLQGDTRRGHTGRLFDLMARYVLPAVQAEAAAP
ncbi:MAG: serine hydrolase [Bacteroidetes bacterium]|nr:serine hydrolase [Bacteroidota bacterium]